MVKARWPRSSAAEDTVLCSWARHLTITVPLFTQDYKGYRRIVGET